MTKTVPEGIAEMLRALDEGFFPDAFEPRYRNTP